MAHPHLDLIHRPRRNRKSAVVRDLVRETDLTAQHLVLPVFLHDEPTDHAIDSMPGCTRWSVEGLVAEAGRAVDLGIRAVILFPAIAEGLKTPTADECYNPTGWCPGPSDP